MTVSEVIAEIERLAPEDQAEVIQFAYRLDAERRLTGKELSALAKCLVESTDPAQGAMLREAIVCGFYGGRPHA